MKHYARVSRPHPTKNPLHPSALDLNGLNVGKHIIVFDAHYGVLFEGIVTSRPYVLSQQLFENSSPSNELVINVRTIVADQLEGPELFVSDMGIINFAENGPEWSKYVFTIDAKKRHLLPEATLPSLDEYDWGAYDDMQKELLNEMESRIFD